ncbi:MAG: SDR family NAD(P)-dependent oxidoreductase, partial [Phycisphaerae bacterium]
MTTSTDEFGNAAALITGASSGIGRATALRLAAGGARVGLLGRDRASLSNVAREIADAGGTAQSFVADVTNRSEVDAAVWSLTDAVGPLTILVNHAGAGRSAPFAKMSAELWHDMLSVNLTGAFHVTQSVLPHMLGAGGGRIVNVASVSGLKGDRYISAYAAAKHGLIGLTRCLAVELASKHITVNAVCPGYVDTPMTQATLSNIVDKTARTPEQARKEIESASPQRRIFEPEEVAAMVAYLC